MNRIKQLREEKGLLQKALADYLGLEIAAISKLETGRVPLKDEYIVKLAEYFKVSTDYLLGKSNERTEKIKEDKKFIAFYNGYKDLNEDDKNIIDIIMAKYQKKK